MLAARAVDQKVQRLHQILFLEPNPIPVKYAMSYMGLIEPIMRLPLTPLAAQFQGEVTKAIDECLN